MRPVMMWITVPDDQQAAAITEALLAEKLVACVSVLRGVHSRYWWKGSRETASEILLTAKTLSVNVPAVIRRVRALHSYEVPEIVAIPIAAGNPAYLRWLRASIAVVNNTRSKRKPRTARPVNRVKGRVP